MAEQFVPRSFVNVPKGTEPPPDAPKLNADFLNNALQPAVEEAHAHSKLDGLAHGGYVIHAIQSAAYPAAPYHLMHVLEEDTGNRFYNVGDETTPDWQPWGGGGGGAAAPAVLPDILSQKNFVVSGIVPTIQPVVAPAIPRHVDLSAGVAWLSDATVRHDYPGTTGIDVSGRGNGRKFWGLNANGLLIRQNVPYSEPAPPAGGVWVMDTDVSGGTGYDNYWITISTVLANTDYTVTINGYPITITSGGAPTADEIGNALRDAIAAANNNQAAEPVYNLVSVSWDTTNQRINLWGWSDGQVIDTTVDANMTAAKQQSATPGTLNAARTIHTRPEHRGDIEYAEGEVEFVFPGTLSVQQGTKRWYAPRDLEITEIIMSLTTLSEGDYVRIALMRGRGGDYGGVDSEAPANIFLQDPEVGTGRQYTVIRASEYNDYQYSLKSGESLDSYDRASGTNPQFLRVDITTVGTTVPGADLTVQVRYRYRKQ